MKQLDANEDFFDGDNDLNNIIRINNSELESEETEDYDLDYDPNEMYYALNGM
ncbi:hypothetical protein [Flavobacterium caeni]|uniref:Uncharacterized protein n=1 Tax=Flavobacterium caeni TaxID=490189 RepID=A0A1G5D6J3_9FLAO|nr:hypothetical protein [Flavobacterium caeni]SCY10158.1 hypothetical protein SAMN02927903_00762 [Flavobacterium caeni]